MAATAQKDTLCDFFNIAAGKTALVVIDAQRLYGDPRLGRGTRATRTTSKRIQSASQAFRKAGLPVYAVYYSPTREPVLPPPFHFYEFTPQRSDILVPKNASSAFEGSDIAKRLKRNGHSRILVCGFNLRACVEFTAIDAVLHGIDVCLLRDLCANDKPNLKIERDKRPALRRMKEAGIRITTAHAALKAIAKNKRRKQTP